MQKKILYILNIANRVNNFSYTSMLAAQELGFDYHIAGNWGYKSDDERIADEKKYNIHIYQIDFVRAPYHPGNIKAYKQLDSIISREKFDIIHCNTPIGGVVGRLLGKKHKVPTVIYQAHGFHFFKGAPILNWILYYPIEKWLAHYTDSLITINHEDFDRAKSLKLRNNGSVYYVPGVGIDRMLFSDFCLTGKKEKLRKLKLPNNAFVLISVGELNKNKNVGTILCSIKKMNNSNIHFLICGKGKEFFRLKRVAKELGIENNVHFLGFRTDVIELYSVANAFILSSCREGLSRSIMEAMASGLPCVVSNIRGNVDLITDGEGGFLCDPKDSKGFAEKIQLLFLNRKVCESMRIKNIEKIKEFDIDSSKNALTKVYKECK